MKSLVTGVLVLSLFVIGTASVRADAVYHTERLTLVPVGNAAGTGMVVNIHPNGPNVYAIEQYQLRRADANTWYQVTLNLYLEQENCEEAPAASLDTALIKTNGAGNGTGQLRLTPEIVDEFGLRNMSFPINWTVTQGGVLTHETRCTIVTLD